MTPRSLRATTLVVPSSNYEKLEAILVMTVFALLAGYVLYAF